MYIKIKNRYFIFISESSDSDNSDNNAIIRAFNRIILINDRDYNIATISNKSLFLFYVNKDKKKFLYFYLVYNFISASNNSLNLNNKVNDFNINLHFKFLIKLLKKENSYYKEKKLIKSFIQNIIQARKLKATLKIVEK